jgi:hypothetical protein
LSAKGNDLANLVVDGSRAKMRDGLIKIVGSYSEAVQGLMDAITMVQKQDGWTPEAHDAVGRALAALPKSDPVDKLTFLDIAKSKDFGSRIPEDAQLILGLKQSDDWFPISVMSFCRNPLTFIVVEEGGLAYKMGFRTNYQLLKFAGETPTSLLNLKALIKANLGKKVESIVRREKKEVKLQIKIPSEIGTK